jgi:Pyridoxal-dependent decarboxylase conserved domain
VVATAGTTGTGSVDPLPELRRCCDEELLWLHVDGAYRAPAAMCPEAKELLTGLEGADSRDGTIVDADIGASAISNDELAGGSVRSGEVLNGSLRDEGLQAGLARERRERALRQLRGAIGGPARQRGRGLPGGPARTRRRCVLRQP